MGTACSPAYAQMLLPPCSNLIKGYVQNSDAKTVSMSWTPNPLTLTYFWGERKRRLLLMSESFMFVKTFSGGVNHALQLTLNKKWYVLWKPFWWTLLLIAIMLHHILCYKKKFPIKVKAWNIKRKVRTGLHFHRWTASQVTRDITVIYSWTGRTSKTSQCVGGVCCTTLGISEEPLRSKRLNSY